MPLIWLTNWVTAQMQERVRFRAMRRPATFGRLTDTLPAHLSQNRVLDCGAQVFGWRTNWGHAAVPAIHQQARIPAHHLKRWQGCMPP